MILPQIHPTLVLPLAPLVPIEFMAISLFGIPAQMVYKTEHVRIYSLAVTNDKPFITYAVYQETYEKGCSLIGHLKASDQVLNTVEEALQSVLKLPERPSQAQMSIPAVEIAPVTTP